MVKYKVERAYLAVAENRHKVKILILAIQLAKTLHIAINLHDKPTVRVDR